MSSWRAWVFRIEIVRNEVVSLAHHGAVPGDEEHRKIVGLRDGGDLLQRTEDSGSSGLSVKHQAQLDVVIECSATALEQIANGFCIGHGELQVHRLLTVLVDSHGNHMCGR